MNILQLKKKMHRAGLKATGRKDINGLHICKLLHSHLGIFNVIGFTMKYTNWFPWHFSIAFMFCFIFVWFSQKCFIFRKNKNSFTNQQVTITFCCVCVCVANHMGIERHQLFSVYFFGFSFSYISQKAKKKRTKRMTVNFFPSNFNIHEFQWHCTYGMRLLSMTKFAVADHG